jgi:hypothetical protein
VLFGELTTIQSGAIVICRYCRWRCKASWCICIADGALRQCFSKVFVRGPSKLDLPLWPPPPIDAFTCEEKLLYFHFVNLYIRIYIYYFYLQYCIVLNILFRYNTLNRSQWLHGLKRGSVAARMLRLRVRILLGTWMFVSCKWCVLSGRGLCVGRITHREESYRVWCVWMWSWSLDMRRPWPTRDCCAMGKKHCLLTQVKIFC